jgi:hypothetical protein
MADFTLTPAAFKVVSGKPKIGTSAAAFNAGAAIYKKTDGTWDKGRANAVGTAGGFGRTAVAVTDSLVAGATFLYLEAGDFLNSGMTPGQIYLWSAATAGLFAPAADVDTANGYATYAFVALSATLGHLINYATGVTL